MFEITNTTSLVNEMALANPDVLALRYKFEELSYREFNTSALTIAAVLVKNGARNETVGIFGQRNITSCLGVLSALYAGCSYTPINTNFAVDKIEQIIKASSVRFVIGRFVDLEPYYDLLAKHKIKALLPSDIVKNPKSIFIGKDIIHLTKALDSPCKIEDYDTAYIMYTSGSTGSPKGVQVTHQNLSAFLHNMNRLYSVPIGFRSSQTFDLSFDLSVCDMFFTWINSGTLCILPEEEKLLPSEYIRREKIYFWYSVPTLASIMDRFGVVTENAFPSLRYSLFCGEPFPVAMAEKWALAAPQSTVENVYGPTEATIHFTRRVYQKSDAGREFSNGIMPVGLPFSDHTVKVIDDDGSLLSHGNIGQLVYKGPQITKGYLHDAEKTESTFVQFNWDPSGEIWYLSGDLGFYNVDGDLECLGRLDSQIKIAGRRVEIGEIECILRKFSKLSDACVIPIRNKNLSVVKLVAFTTVEVSEEEEKEIRLNSQKFLEAMFLPSNFYTIDEFPLTHSGKIDRRKLLALWEQK